ncbi:MAG: cytochrome C oxidase subunit IV family protein [Verrucomicrobia bacterium]|nr:cytochrome C oxidase subunit IV family protein [Verrucomicrobiota bacterium]MBI3870667.1 cytochrome C oxidase subunit IV family protein [Verrucomicrobiota bacterium]
MSDHHSAHDIEASKKRYIAVFVALLVGTGITVGAYFLRIDSMALTITLALFIASVKAFLVAGFFMHLIDEKKMIYGILASTVFFFIGLMGLTIWALHDFPTNTMLH